MLQFRPIVTEDLELLLDLIPPIDPDPDVVDWTARQLRKCVSIGPSASVGFGNHHFSNFARTVVENNRVVGCVTCSLLAPDFLDEIAEARSKERWYDISMRPSLKDEEFEGPLDLLLTSCFWKTGEGGVPDLQFLETALQRFTRYFEGNRIGRVAATVTTKFAPVIQGVKYVVPAGDCSIVPLTGDLHLLTVTGPWKGLGIFGDWGKRLLRPYEPSPCKEFLTLQQRRVARVLHEYKFDFVEATKCGAIPTWTYKETESGRMQDSVTGYGAWSMEVTARLNIQPGRRKSKVEGLQAFFASNPSAMTP
ncbi:MAG TPA: hypothetical protein PL050_03110 [Fimbriimonadaceae bacterium]|nr:hypothetical protein [Fimbriimonadaceae bacterium]